MYKVQLFLVNVANMIHMVHKEKNKLFYLHKDSYVKTGKKTFLYLY